LAQISSAQAIQELAVNNCREKNQSAGVFFGASFIVAGNNVPGVEFICPIDAASVAPSDLQTVNVSMHIANSSDIATVELCFTDMHASGFPTENCGPVSLSNGAGLQILKAAPPKTNKFSDSMVAFIKVWIPAPDPYGYSFLRGFEVYQNTP
jgi:hypothetical protein